MKNYAEKIQSFYEYVHKFYNHEDGLYPLTDMDTIVTNQSFNLIPFGVEANRITDMTTTEVIIEIIYAMANALFPIAILFFVGGFIYDMTQRRAKHKKQ